MSFLLELNLTVKLNELIARAAPLQCHDPRDLRDGGRAVPSAFAEMSAWNQGA